MSEPNEVQKNSVNEPSSYSDTAPTGSLGKRATRGAINGIKNGIRNIGKMIPMHIKLLVFGPVLLIVCIFILLMAIFNFSLSSEKSDTAVSASTIYVESQSFNSGNKAKEYFNNSSSLLLFNLKDINGLYDSTIKSARDSTKNDFSYELGSTAVSNEESRIVDINEKLPIYKHILLTEKYNFNNIVWKVYGHSYNGEEIKDINTGNIKMKEDKDLGITYPEKGNNESDYKLDKFTDLVYPYLQTWYIPLAFLSASTTTGTEDTANNPQFSYNIIKEAYSKIVINRYEIQKETVKTYYTEIDKVTKHNKITVQVNKKTVTTKTKDEDGNTVGNESSSVTYLVAPLAVGTNYSQDLTSAQRFSQVTDNTEHQNSRYDENKKEDPTKETFVNDSKSTTSKYYISEAKTFDLKVINEFNYTKYNEQDVENRVNPKSQKIDDDYTYTEPSENTQNKSIISIAPDAINGEGNSNISSLFSSKIPNNRFTFTQKEELNSDNKYENTSSTTENAVTTTITTTVEPYAIYEINIDPFVEYENGVKHNVTRQWEDELSQTKSTNSAYTIDDLIEFNQSDDRAEKVSAQDLCGTAASINENGLKGQRFDYTNVDQLQVGDILHSTGHVVMYIGNYNGTPSIISQGGSGDPSIYPAAEYASSHGIFEGARYINSTSISGSNGVSSSSSSSTTACNTEDGQYYKLYEKNKELNLIDFINSNPGIYKNYTRSSYSDYIGYSRGYLVYHYSELKRVLGNLKGEDGLLPFVYGQSLGFGVQPIDTQISSSMASSGSSGLRAMCQKAIELTNGNKGLWHYCQGGNNTTGKHENEKNGITYGRFSFDSIEKMNQYIDLANRGEPVGTDCSAFVRSMYLTYTGIDIDPRGGANIRHNSKSK